MSNTHTEQTSELRLVPLDAITVAEGANPRRRFDEHALRELADSITKHGLIQPLVVRTDDGGYTLIAGERRYRAAKLAGLKQVPVTLRNGDESALELAVDENLHRQNLDPVEEAHAFQAILRSGKLNKKQLAERVSKSAGYVNERLRLLDLPEKIQDHVATGKVPVRLAKQLIEMAKASEPVTVACVQLVVNGSVEVEELEQRPERVIGCLGDHEWHEPQPVALAVSNYHQYELDSLPLPAEGADDIRERYTALGEEVGFCFDQQDADAARSYGCLLEFKNGNFWSASYITDPAFIADRVRLKLDAYERQLKKRERDAARSDHDSPPEGVDAVKEQRRQERQQKAEEKQAAIAANFELGRKLQLRYDAPKITAPVAKLLALLLLDAQAERLAGRGLRYVREDWQLIEAKEVSGKSVEKPRYPRGDEAAEQLYAWIERARTPEQVVGRLLQALIAAHAADEQAVAASSRVHWQLPGAYDDGPSSEIPTLLDRLAKSVLPRRLAANGESAKQTKSAKAA
jgi:ParB family transcriptional regulator, chromosome partitioning protein